MAELFLNSTTSELDAVQVLRVFLKRLLSVLLGPLLLIAAAQTATLSDVLTHIQANRAATDFRATGRLVRVDGQRRTTYQVSLRAKVFSGVLKLFCEITDPATARVRLLLESFPDGRGMIQTGHAGDSAATELPPNRWSESLLGTDFSVEDLMDPQFQWKNQAIVQEALFGARPSIVLKSVPGTSPHTGYSMVVTWLDKQIFYPLKEEKTVKGSNVVKEYVFYGLRQSQGVWSATQIECRVKGKSGSTLLIINRGSEKAHLDENAFSASLLIKK